MPHIRLRTRRAVVPVALLTLAGVVLSCRDAASPPEPPLQTTRGDVAPAPFTATFGLANDTSTANSMGLNDYSEARAVRISVSGTLTGHHLTDPSQNRTFGPNGWNCEATVSVSYSGMGGLGPTCGNPGGTEGISAIVKVQGHGTITRGRSWSIMCYDQSRVCWSYTGEQQVTVQVIDYPGVITAWSSIQQKVVTAIPAPEWLYFSWKPAYDSGSPPKQGYDWRYVPADGSKPDTLGQWYGYETNVSYKPMKSGTMYVNVKINGVQKTLSQYIHVGPATLTLSATPTEVYVGDSVHFTADIKPDTTAVTDIHWFWLANVQVISTLRASTGSSSKPSKSPTRTSAAASLQGTDSSTEVGSCAGYPTCDFVVQGKGTMRVQATVAGAAKVAEKPLDPARIDVELTVDPASVKEGGKVTFKARSLPRGRTVRVKSWTWVASSSPALTVATTCKTGEDTCELEVWETGVMQIVATIDKQAGEFIAAENVVVTPCDPLTGDYADPLLAKSTTRKEFLDLLAKTNPNDPVDLYTRREVGGRVATDGNGNYRLVEVQGGQGTGAGSYEPPSPPDWPSPPAGWQWTSWIWHAHPHTYGEIVYGGTTLNNRRCEERKGDADRRKSEGYVLCTSGQGPSPNDLLYNLGVGYGFSGFIIDKSGNYYRYDYPAFRDTQERDRRILRWKRQKNSACFEPSPCDNFECRRTR